MASQGGVDFKAQVLAATDLVQLVARTVALKKLGSKYVGLCPFHNEKSPSFNVNPSKQMFHCFGCKAGGNAIDFVMKRDGLEFKDALQVLGQEAGLEMPQFGASKQKADERKMLLEAQSAACAYFEANLRQPQLGAAARAYLEQRGFNAKATQRFQLGLAADAWDGLLRSAAMRKFPPRLLASGGLLVSREGGNGFYDFFRNRLMFPIRDRQGRVIAFGGRIMPGSTDPRKYLNSPETLLFNKSACVYGIDTAAARIAETGTAVIVEGYADVVMAHQFGVSNVVAALGTGVTAQHVTQLRRLGHKIILLFDADKAGDSAADRVMVELFLTQPIEIGIASLPQGVDPDEYLLAHGAAEFEKVLASAADVLTFKWRQLSREFAAHAGDMTGQQEAVDKYLKLLGNARGSGPVDPVRWGSALARVSRLTELPIDELNARFKARGAPRRPNGPMANRGLSPAPGTGGEGRGGGRGLSDAPPAPNAQSAGRPGMPRAQRTAERWLLGALFIDSQRWDQVQLDVALDDFADPRCKALAEVFWDTKRHEGDVVFNEFLALLMEPALTELAVELVEEVEQLAGHSSLDEILGGVITWILQQRRRREEIKLLGGLRRTMVNPTANRDDGRPSIENSAADATPLVGLPPDFDGIAGVSDADESAAVFEPQHLGDEPVMSEAPSHDAFTGHDAGEAVLNSQASRPVTASSAPTATPGPSAQGIDGASTPQTVSGQEQAKLLLFEQLVKKTQTTDLRRLGPVRRSRS